MAARYPGWPMISPAYPTRDHVMPWRLFIVLAAGLQHSIAAERRLMSAAIMDAFSDDTATWQEVTDLALPIIGPPIEPDVLFRKD